MSKSIRYRILPFATILLTVFVIACAAAVHAAQGFVPLADVSDSPKLTGLYSSGDLATYLTRVFYFALSIGAILAVGRIAWAGYLYMTTDLWSSKERAKETLRETILGLLLLLAVWLILNQINPNILNLNINIKPVPTTPASTSAVESVSPPPTIINTTSTYSDPTTNYTVSGVPTLTYPSNPKTTGDAKAIQDARSTFAAECMKRGPDYELKTSSGRDQCVFVRPPIVIGTPVASPEQIPTEVTCLKNEFGFARCTYPQAATGTHLKGSVCGRFFEKNQIICGFQNVEQCKATLIDVGFNLDNCQVLE